MDDEFERRLEEERAQVEARYREVLKNSVAFEKRIRNRWREKNRAKNARITALEARVAELQGELREAKSLLEGAKVMERATKEEKLVALMVNDLGSADLDEREMSRLHGEVNALPDEELDRTLADRLGLSYPVDAGSLNDALTGVTEPEKLSREDYTGAPDMSHEPRPEER